MSIPQPPNRKAASGFTLIELLVVISIIALLVSVTIPIYKIVMDGANSARSVANLKSIGTALTVYTAENNNNLPPLEQEEPFEWGGVDLDIPIQELAALPTWASTLIYSAAKSDSDLTRNVFSCPGLRWRDANGDKMPSDEILLAYGATDALRGFNEDNELSPTLARNIATIENRPRTVLVCETKQEGNTPTSFPAATWGEARRDFGKGSHKASAILDFRFKKTLNCLMADGSAEAFRFADGDRLQEPNWTGENYDTIN